MSDPILEVRDLWVRVHPPDGMGGALAVVRGADFDLERGTVSCLVGESGSGKTLLMRSLLGISRAHPGVTAGEAWLLPDEGPARIPLLGSSGRPKGSVLLSGLRPGWAGYVFQHPEHSLDPFRRVIDQVMDSVTIRSPFLAEEERKRQALGWLERVHLHSARSVGTKFPHELSGGMARRVAIAIALATDPDLLVADEPTTGLDWSARREIVDLLRDLCRTRGMTLLLITHDFQVVEHVAEELHVMFRGELVESGPRNAFFAPGPGAHPYTRELQSRSRALEQGTATPRLYVADREGPSNTGCCYAHRCPWIHAPSPQRLVLGERCRSVRPPDFHPREGHRVRCMAIGEGT